MSYTWNYPARRFGLPPHRLSLTTNPAVIYLRAFTSLINEPCLNCLPARPELEN